MTGEGADGARTADGGFGEETGVYVCGLRMNSGSGAASSEGAGLSFSVGAKLCASSSCRCSGSGPGERSRSSTIPKAGRVALIAGVITVGSGGRDLNIDCRICLDARGESDGGEDDNEPLSCKIVSEIWSPWGWYYILLLAFG